MQHVFFQKKKCFDVLTPIPGSMACLYVKYSLLCCCMHRSLQFDMHSDNTSKKFHFGLAPPAMSIQGSDQDLQTYNKEESKYQEVIQSSTTPDPGFQWDSDNFSIRHHTRESKGHPFSSR